MPSFLIRQASLKVICIPALLSSSRQAMVTSTQPELVRPGAKPQGTQGAMRGSFGKWFNGIFDGGLMVV
jgi:hypothetical protein